MNRHRTLVVLGALILLVSALLSAAGRSEVADAVMNGDRAALGALLQRKADVNAPQADGATALHWAVYRTMPTRRIADSRRREARHGESRGHHAARHGLPVWQRLDDQQVGQGRCGRPSNADQTVERF
jgi:hypothetical protein